MHWFRILYARHLDPNNPRDFWGHVSACLAIAYFLSLHIWTFLLIYQRIIFYDFFILGEGLLLYFPVVIGVIIYAFIDRTGIKATVSYCATLLPAQKKKYKRKAWTYYLASLAILFLTVKVSPHIRPSHDRVVAALYGDSEYWRYAAVYEMGDSRDTFYIRHLMRGIDDRRISLTANAKGSCMISAKTSALSKITGDSVRLRYRCYPDEAAVEVVNYWKQKYPQYYVPHKQHIPPVDVSSPLVEVSTSTKH